METLEERFAETFGQPLKKESVVKISGKNDTMLLSRKEVLEFILLDRATRDRELLAKVKEYSLQNSNEETSYAFQKQGSAGAWGYGLALEEVEALLAESSK